MSEWELVSMVELSGFVKLEDDTQALKEGERFEGWASEEPDVAGAGNLVADCG